MKKITIAFLAGACACVALFALYSYRPEPDTAQGRYRDDFQIVRSVHVPKKLTFCGEAVPLDDRDVFESLEREIQTNTYLHSHTLLVLKRSTRWKPLLTKMLKQQNVPEDMFYLAVAESDLSPYALSISGAKGIWQFMEDTGEEYGLEASKHVEMRRDPHQATIAFAAYIKKAKERFGSWTNAAASYNRGMNGFDRALEKQKQSSFYELYLNKETARYVFRILALKIIMEDPERYGYYLDRKDCYPPYEYEEMTVSQTIENLPDFAESKGISYKTLRQYNPWLADVYDYRLPVPEGKSYTLRLPKKKK